MLHPTSSHFTALRMTAPPSHGGRRPGAGRKPGYGPFGEATVPIRVPASQAETVRAWLDRQKQRPSHRAAADAGAVEWVGPAALEPATLARPLFLSRVRAGFPSPADDYVEERIDLNAHLVKHPAATFFLRVKGHSMTGAGIFDHDLVVVDRSLDPVNGAVVIAVIDGELTVKRLALLLGGEVELRPENPEFPVIRLNEFQELSIWGVVTDVIHSVRP